MRSKPQLAPAPSFESIWAALQETEKMLKKQERASAAFDRKMKAINKRIGGIENSNGAMAEEYFYNAFRRHKVFVNEKFDHIKRNFVCLDEDFYEWDSSAEAELDILLFNGKSAAIIEVKYRANKNNVSITKLIKRIEIIKRLYPEYAHHTFYLGVAAFSFGKGTPERLHRAGIATVYQIGNKMIIYDKEVKAF